MYMHLPLWYYLIFEGTAWWLLVAWCLFGARTSASWRCSPVSGASPIKRFAYFFIICQEDIRPRTERMQLLAESKTKQELEKRIDFVQRLSKYSKSELQAILKKLDGDLQGEREGVQQSRMEESGVIHKNCNVMHLPLSYCLIIEETMWWLLVAWCPYGARTSATIVMT